VVSKPSAIGAALPLCLLLVSGCINAPDLGGSPTPVAVPATLDVSPADNRVGNVVLSLAFEAPRHMVDQAAFFAAANTNAMNADSAQPTQTVPESTSQGALVLSDMLRVTNNMDPTQALPIDSQQLIVRHVAIQVRTGDTGQPVPYLGVSLDLLLDGKPMSSGQSAVPMVAQNADSPRLYYGNNVRLTQRGMYQVFVRLTRNALLGKDPPQAAQFNVLVH
jgi:hypothetical protein